MARERLLKPRFFKSEQVAALSFPARLLFQSLWCQADRNGILKCNEKLLRAETFPCDDCITPSKVGKMLEEIAAQNLIFFHHENGAKYCVITGWKNQKVHPKEPASHFLAALNNIIESGEKVSNPTLPSLPSFPSLPTLRVRSPQAAVAAAPASGDSGEQEPEAGEGEGPTEDAPAQPCPLEAVPRIRAKYIGIRAALDRVHPRSKNPPLGTKAELLDRVALASLVRLDKFTEDDVLKTLAWVLKGETENAAFWQGNFHCIARLRVKKNGATKFAKMFEAMSRDKVKITPKRPLDEVDLIMARLKGVTAA